MEQLSLSNTCKPCKTCGEVKPLSMFYANKATRDGKHIYCKACTRARINTYYDNRKGAERACTKCGNIQDGSCFYPRTNICKTCSSLRHKATKAGIAVDYKRACGVDEEQSDNWASIGHVRDVRSVEHALPGVYGCFTWDGIKAECQCGERFIPTTLDMKYARACWHLERQRQNNWLVKTMLQRVEL